MKNEIVCEAPLEVIKERIDFCWQRNGEMEEMRISPLNTWLFTISHHSVQKISLSYLVDKRFVGSNTCKQSSNLLDLQRKEINKTRTYLKRDADI
ncbi:hypothetical protein P5673_000420 [Acropora cervicornis]|uniref:Uncharacterized protein n=1 Tax=Acropora cervicornis TaxID=6130 RepID=A0AAD9R730_ACRCE|nr:hypothetical protein P5673_000420 [Acropora cervicornis]